MCSPWSKEAGELFSSMASSWKPRNVPMSQALKDLIAMLWEEGAEVYLLGGGVLARDCGKIPPYYNLLVEVGDFKAIKKALFEYGVVPVSTPDLPAEYIRFVYQERVYSALNMSLADYLERNVLGQRLQLLPLAHNFLVEDPSRRRVMDPYGALSESGNQQHADTIKLIRQPDSVVTGLEVCLAVAFDTALLGLKAPARFGAMERSVLGTVISTKSDSLLVFHRMLSYLPDLLEVRGWPSVRRYLRAPLCVSAAGGDPGIDLRQVEASLERVARRGQAITGAHLFAAINRQFEPRSQVAGAGLPDFLASRQLPVRRKDLLAKVLVEKDPLAEV